MLTYSYRILLICWTSLASAIPAYNQQTAKQSKQSQNRYQSLGNYQRDWSCYLGYYLQADLCQHLRIWSMISSIKFNSPFFLFLSRLSLISPQKSSNRNDPNPNRIPSLPPSYYVITSYYIYRPIIFYWMTSQKATFSGPKYKIILIGDSGVGKTSIFWRYIQNQPMLDQPMTTIDFRYKLIHLHERQVKLCIWDTAGQEKFRSIVATYFKSCQGVVLVFDLSNRLSWENVKNVWYQLAFKRAPSANYLLLGNKKDLEHVVTYDEIHSWCTEKGIYYIQSCAVTGQAIEQSFFTLAALIDSKQTFLSQCSASMGQSFEETTKVGTITKEGSQRSSVMAVYEHEKAQSFFLKGNKRSKKKQKCCS